VIESRPASSTILGMSWFLVWYANVQLLSDTRSMLILYRRTARNNCSQRVIKARASAVSMAHAHSHMHIVFWFESYIGLSFEDYIIINIYFERCESLCLLVWACVRASANSSKTRPSWDSKLEQYVYRFRDIWHIEMFPDWQLFGVLVWVWMCRLIVEMHLY
jgi:hypothetical protein